MTDAGHKHVYYANVLTALACICVIVLHVSLDVYTPHAADHWLHSLTLQALAISATPIFFMLSGMKLLDYRSRYSTKEFFTRRAVKTGLALVVGSVLSYIIYGLFPHAFWDAERLGITFSPCDFLKLFFANGINDTYWFFYTILGLYALTPLLSKVVKDETTETYTLVVSIALSIGLPCVRRLVGNTANISPLFDWPLFSSEAVTYYLLGHWLSRHNKTLPHNPLVWLALFIFSTAIMILVAAAQTGVFKGILNESYDSYLIGITSPLCFIQVVSLYVMCMQLEPHYSKLPSALRRAIDYVSHVSLVIYLVHTPITNWVSAGAPRWLGVLLNSHKPLEALFVFACSLLLAFCWDCLLVRIRRMH